MATRLEITHGLIAERDRLSTSADTLSVIRPTTGSKTRSKGVLFVLVSSTLPLSYQQMCQEVIDPRILVA